MSDPTPLGPIAFGVLQDGTGVSSAVKQTLLDCFEHAAWADDQGQTYYNALLNAFYPLDHITAVYTQSGTVYDTDSLDSLKTDLVVTAVYESGDTETIDAADYTLSGTLTVGTSTITVSYGGKTATFDVEVSTYDTSPVIVETGKYRSPSGNSTSNAEGWGITQKYKVRWQKNDVYKIKVANTTNPPVGLSAYTGTENNYSTQWSISGTKDINVNYTFADCWLEASIKLADIADTYLYNNTSGDIVFAGANTPYYGKQNIHE